MTSNQFPWKTFSIIALITMWNFAGFSEETPTFTNKDLEKYNKQTPYKSSSPKPKKPSERSADTAELSKPSHNKTSLWQVKGKKNTLYILGSIHALPENAYPLPKVMNDAYQKSKIIYFEADVQNQESVQGSLQPMITQQMGNMADEPKNKVSAENLSLLKSKSESFGMPVEMFSFFEPWLLAAMLQQMAVQNAGFKMENGLDIHFMNSAKQDGKKLHFFETVEEQLKLLSGMNNDEQNKFLQASIESYDQMPTLLPKLYRSWRAGDINTLQEFAKTSIGEGNLKNRLYKERNERWIQSILQALNQPENVLVVVGVGHLVGEHSVIDLLRGRGYSAMQM